MRTILVHLRDAHEKDVADYLNHTYPVQPGPPWILDAAGDAVLFINFYRDLGTEYSDEDMTALVKFLGREPKISVSVDISGRHKGNQEIRAFVCGLLSEFQGVAQDEYTNHFWTMEEIANGFRVKGNSFFSYKNLEENGPQYNN